MSQTGFRAPLRARRIALPLAAAVLVVALTLFYAAIFGQVPRISDFAGSLLAGRDMLEGNWRLAGWWLPTDPFWSSDLPVYGLASLFLGVQVRTLLYVPALLWAGLSVATCWIAVAMAHPGGRLRALGTATILMGLPLFRTSPTMTQIAQAPMHVASLLLVLAMFTAGARIMSRPAAGSGARTAWLALATLLGVAGDPLLVVVGTLPLLAVAAFGGTGTPKVRLRVFATTGLASVAAKLLLSLNSHNGGFIVVHSGTLSLAYAPLPQIGANFVLVLQGLFQVFGASVFGAEAARALAELTRLPLLLIALASAIALIGWIGRRLLGPGWGMRTVPDAPPPLLTMLALGIGLDIVAMLVSRVVIDDYSAARYLLPTLTFGAILAARGVSRMAWGRLLVPVSLVLSLINLADDYRTGPDHMVPALPDVQQLAGWLLAHHLAEGYGPYGSASIITVLTEGRVALRPVARNSRGGIDMLRFLVKRTWYPTPFRSRKPEFVVVDRQNEQSAFRLQDVIATFGEPVRTGAVAHYTVLIYRPGG